MRVLFAAGIVTLMASTAVAQMRLSSQGLSGYASGFASRSVSARAGFGNILYPGTGGPPPVGHSTFAQRLGSTISGNYRGSTFAQRLGATVSGYHGNLRGAGRGVLHSRPHWGRYRTPVVGYIPAFYGGFGYAPSPPQQVQVTVQNVPAPQPPVIINQYYNAPNPQPVLKDYTKENLPEPEAGGMITFRAPVPSHPEPKVQNAGEQASQEATLYLIAYKDHSIYPAVGYWVEGDTLHYITMQGTHNRASVDLIDRDLSQKLNRERNVEFELEFP